jgi:hypothetical protein
MNGDTRTQSHAQRISIRILPPSSVALALQTELREYLSPLAGSARSADNTLVHLAACDSVAALDSLKDLPWSAEQLPGSVTI